MLHPPAWFRSLPGALRVRLTLNAPGASAPRVEARAGPHRRRSGPCPRRAALGLEVGEHRQDPPVLLGRLSKAELVEDARDEPLDGGDRDHEFLR
jgi:hypothetical protein